MESTQQNISPYHVPALLIESVNLLITNPSGVYVDVTFGGGGHSRKILESLNAEGRLLAFDRDMDAYANSPDDGRFTFVHSNFRHLENFLKFHKIDKVDGILADLGVSFHHFDIPERGFSFRHDAPLDMRMNRDAAVTAADVIASSDEKQILSLFREFADLRNPSAVAKAITEAKNQKPIETTTELAQAVAKAIDPRQEKKELAQVFQAFRIAANHEIEDLEKFLMATLKVLKSGGRLAVLTYHSVEDRMVKNFMKTGNPEGKSEKDFYGNISTPWEIVTRKPIEPSAEEIERNPRSRSAKLRVAQLK